MKTKVLSLTLASVMTIQSVGYAATDRTAGIGDQAIAESQAKLNQLKISLQSFDDTLAETEKAIIQQDHSGNFVNGLTIGAAALGVAVGGFALYVAGNKSESAGVVSIPFFIASAGASVVSSVAGMFSVNRKSSGDVKSAQAELTKTQNLINEARTAKLTAEQDQLITRLEKDLSETQQALTAYDKNGTDLTRNRLISRAVQLGGTVLVVASMVITAKQTTGPNAATGSILGKAAAWGLMLGGVTTAGGHIATIVTGLQSYKAKEVLKEIAQTRGSIQSLLAQLN